VAQWLVPARIAVALVLVLIASRSAYLAVKIVGVDTASLVYVYFPEDAREVRHELYSLVRHPMYMAVALMGVVGFLTNFSWYGVVVLGVVWGTFTFHVMLEEKELLERFGDSYRTYARGVPAVLVRPRHWGTFLRFLVQGN
jgi:protein-S-isoprenylcysteine O-methyltransferase Ste14